ncbi:hypothetical protein CUMW_101070 [Citrus unshiu]|nr:hypothetical protein CUMW_101070 [Citrus unshiu]
MTRSWSSTHIFAYVSDGLRINTLCRRSPAHENYTGPTQASCSQSRLNCFTASSPLQFLSETSDSRSMNSLLCDWVRIETPRFWKIMSVTVGVSFERKRLGSRIEVDVYFSFSDLAHLGHIVIVFHPWMTTAMFLQD